LGADKARILSQYPKPTRRPTRQRKLVARPYFAVAILYYRKDRWKIQTTRAEDRDEMIETRRSSMDGEKRRR